MWHRGRQSRVLGCQQGPKAPLVGTNAERREAIAFGDAVPEHESAPATLKYDLQNVQVLERRRKLCDEACPAHLRDLELFFPVGRPSGPIEYPPVLVRPEPVLFRKTREGASDCQAEDVADLLDQNIPVKWGTYLETCEVVFRSLAIAWISASYD
jgi:hypothetical protein